MATPAKNKYPNITLLQLSDLLWMPPSKPNQKTQGKKALDVVLRVGDCTKNRVENKQGANPTWSRVVAWNQVEQASVTSFNLIRTDNYERRAPNMRMGWGTVSTCACASYVCNEHQMEGWRHVCRMLSHCGLWRFSYFCFHTPEWYMAFPTNETKIQEEQMWKQGW